MPLEMISQQTGNLGPDSSSAASSRDCNRSTPPVQGLPHLNEVCSYQPQRVYVATDLAVHRRFPTAFDCSGTIGLCKLGPQHSLLLYGGAATLFPAQLISLNTLFPQPKLYLPFRSRDGNGGLIGDNHSHQQMLITRCGLTCANGDENADAQSVRQTASFGPFETFTSGRLEQSNGRARFSSSTLRPSTDFPHWWLSFAGTDYGGHLPLL